MVFLNETYYVNSVMNTTGLCDCEVDLYGTLLVRSSPNQSRRRCRLTPIDSGVRISPTG